MCAGHAPASLPMQAIDIEAIDGQLRDRGIDPESLTEDQVDIQDEPVRAKIKAKVDLLE